MPLPYTSPNQKTVLIHRSDLGRNFLGINNDSWRTAARVLSPPAFLLYIYFASNRDRYTLALSPKAVQQEIGMARSTFYDQINVLESLGYLTKSEDRANGWDFYERPLGVPDAIYKRREEEGDYLNDLPASRSNDVSACGQNHPQENIQIYNKCPPLEDEYILPVAEEESNLNTEERPQRAFKGFDF